MEQKRDAFIVMPFSATTSDSETGWTDVYENVFRPAFEDVGFSCERSSVGTGSLGRSIVHRLRHARIVLADVTDRNANVFYELGVRHALSTRTIIVSRDDKHLPSDLAGYWYSKYETSPGGVARFKTHIRDLIERIESDPDRSDNPVADYLQAENVGVAEVFARQNVNKLNALTTELTGNQICLEKLPSDADSVVMLSDDALKLLLNTMYIDPGPETLQLGYELSLRLKMVSRSPDNRGNLSDAKTVLSQFSRRIDDIRANVAKGLFEEPSVPTEMKWQPIVRVSATGTDGAQTSVASTPGRCAVCGRSF